MVHHSRSISAFILRLIAGLMLLGCPRVGVAGTWSVIALLQEPGKVPNPTAVSVDAAGNLYVVDENGNNAKSRIQQRDTQGNWSVIATPADALGQITALTVDAVGNLYVADVSEENMRVQKRDSQGGWSVLATFGEAVDQVFIVRGLTADTQGNLYLADQAFRFPSGLLGEDRIQMRDTRGNWSVIAPEGGALGKVLRPTGIAADPEGNLYVADLGQDGGRVQKRDVQGNWSAIATVGTAPGQVRDPVALALEAAGNLYVAEGWEGNNRIQQRDTQGNWSVLATRGEAVGQVLGPPGLAVDGAGNLYVADTVNHRVQMFTPVLGQ
jgi:DNA-binding beta-propeller fold protein YncE